MSPNVYAGRIVETAAELIYLHGAENVSFDTVTGMANTRKSQLYYYFANKQALIRAVIKNGLHRMQQVSIWPQIRSLFLHDRSSPR